MLIREYDDARDRDRVTGLADRLTAGARPWRDRDRWLAVVRGWVAESVDAAGEPGHAVYVAEDDAGVQGFVSVTSRRHFTGDLDAYVGELVVSVEAEGHGVGRLLVGAAETWARAQGFRTLTLDTGAANAAARRLYAATGFDEEDVRLTKLLD